MLFHEEPDQCRLSVFETGFTPSEIQELLSLVQTKEPLSSNSSTLGSNRVVYSIAERKHRRMVSNRESAKRSRRRKKWHLENLTNELNRLRVENRDYKNRLGLVTYQYQLVQMENNRLRSEALGLWTRLSDLCQIMLTMQLQ